MNDKDKKFDKMIRETLEKMAQVDPSKDPYLMQSIQSTLLISIVVSLKRQAESLKSQTVAQESIAESLAILAIEYKKAHVQIPDHIIVKGKKLT